MSEQVFDVVQTLFTCVSGRFILHLYRLLLVSLHGLGNSLYMCKHEVLTLYQVLPMTVEGHVKGTYSPEDVFMTERNWVIYVTMKVIIRFGQ